MAHLIEKHPVPLIFKKIFKGALSGELTVTGENVSKKLYFSEGLLLFATSDLKHERLGEMLVRKGVIKKQQFIRFQQEKIKSGSKFGKILVDNNILTRRGLYDALREQVKAIALSLFSITSSITSGKWEFTFGVPDIPGGQNFEVFLPEILVDGIELIPDFSYFKEAFNYKTPEPLPIPESLGHLLPDDHMRFYLKLATSPGFTSAEILALMKLPGTVFWQRLVLLYLLGFLDFAEFKADRRRNLDSAAIDTLIKKMKHNKDDHQDPLELSDTESVSRVSDKYFSMAKTPQQTARTVDFAIINTDVPAEPNNLPAKEKKKS